MPIFDDSRGFSPLFAAVVVVAAGYGGYKIPKEVVINDFNERSKIETSQTNEQSRVEIENEIEQSVAKRGYSLTMPKFA